MPDDKDIAYPFFHQVALVDPQKTKANGGVPVYYNEDFVLIKVPGTRDEVDRPVEPRDKDRWPTIWEKYKKGQEQTIEGTPLTEFATATEAERATLRQLGVHTVEQAAGINDDIAGRVGLHGLKRKAATFLETRSKFADVGKLEARIKALEKLLEEKNANANPVVSGRDESDGVQPAIDVPDEPKPRRKKTGTAS